MVAPILARKAEMMDAVARTKTMQQPEQAPPSVLEQLMAKNNQIEMPVQSPMQGPMPQSPEQVGVGQLPVPERQYAGGGIVAFKQGDLVDLEDDIDEEDLIAEYADAMQAGEMAMAQQPNAGTGIKYSEPMPSGAAKGITYKGGNHPYESMVMAKAKEHGVDPQLAAYILNKETGGLKNPENALSPAGAMGIAQFMPATAKQYGINPNIPEEAALGMSKHLRHLLDKYDNPRVAAIAYNWGEGNTNKWLKAGADMDKLPKETRKYVAQLAEGGEVKHYDGTGPSLVEAKKQREDALRALELGLPDMPSDFKGSLSDYLADPERAALYGKNEKDRNIARKAIMYNNPLPSLGRDVLNPSASMRPAVIAAPSAAALRSGNTAYLPNENPNLDNRDVGMRERIDQAAFSPEEMAAGSSRAGTFAAMNKDETTGRTPTKAEAKTPEESYWDKVMKQMGQERADLAKQKTEDRNMALLAAGLGMMGGTSSNAFTNIGQGGLSGMSYLADANKQRAAQSAALSKNELVAQRYKELGDVAKGNQAGLMAIRQGELAVNQGKLGESQRAHNMTALTQLQKMSESRAQAALKAQGLLGTENINDPQMQQKLNDWVAADLASGPMAPVYQKLHQETYGFPYQVAAPVGGGNATMAQGAAAEKAKREAEKNKEKK